MDAPAVDGFIEQDAGGVISDWSAESDQLFGWSRAETGSHVRIVAMTAHAMTGERERCLAAGMDGSVSKPIDQRTLYVVVEA